MSDTEPKRRRGNYSGTPERRREILATALEVFGERGYRGSSVREVAARAGLSESGVLHHFGGKLGLLLAVLDERDIEYLKVVDATRVDRIVELNQQRPDVVRLFATLSAEATQPDNPGNAWFVKRYAEVRATMASRYRDRQEAGLLSDELDPEVAAQLVMAVMDGLQIQWLLDPEQDMVGPFRVFFDALFGSTDTEQATET